MLGALRKTRKREGGGVVDRISERADDEDDDEIYIQVHIKWERKLNNILE